MTNIPMGLVSSAHTFENPTAAIKLTRWQTYYSSSKFGATRASLFASLGSPSSLSTYPTKEHYFSFPNTSEIIPLNFWHESYYGASTYNGSITYLSGQTQSTPDRSCIAYTSLSNSLTLKGNLRLNNANDFNTFRNNTSTNSADWEALGYQSTTYSQTFRIITANNPTVNLHNRIRTFDGSSDITGQQATLSLQSSGIEITAYFNNTISAPASETFDANWYSDNVADLEAVRWNIRFSISNDGSHWATSNYIDHIKLENV